MAEIVNDRVSIQVGLSGYSFKIETEGRTELSGWMGAESIFTVPQMQKRYSDVQISVFTPLCTLVPENFYQPQNARDLLADMVSLPDAVQVESVNVPEFNAVLLYSNSIGGTLHKVVAESVLNLDGSKASPLPEMYYILKTLPSLEEYNKIVASYMDGMLYLAIAQGKTLMLCNVYPASDFTTAQYFIFLAMKKLQLNPEMSTICFRTPLDQEQQMSLYRYFKSVENL